MYILSMHGAGIEQPSPDKEAEYYRDSACQTSLMRGLLVFFFESPAGKHAVVGRWSLVIGQKTNKNNKLIYFANRVICYQTINLRTNDQRQKTNDLFITGKKNADKNPR